MFRGIVLATLIIARCGDSATAPPVVPAVRLELGLMNADVVDARAVARNGQVQPIYYAQGCGAEDGIWFEAVGPDGRSVRVTPPGLDPACATHVATLVPRAELEAAWRFDGTLYDGRGEPYAAPEGRYVLIARFRWWQAPEANDSVVLEERTTFHWAWDRRNP